MTTLILIPNLTSQQPKINLNPVKGDVSDSELCQNCTGSHIVSICVTSHI